MAIITQQRVMGNCPFCQTFVTNKDKTIVCPGCNVLHHQECWQYNGGCTTYACTGEKPLYRETEDLDFSMDSSSEMCTGNKIVLNIEDLDVDLGDERSSNQELLNDSESKIGVYSSESVKSLSYAGVFGGFITWVIAGQFFSYEYYAHHDQFNLIGIEILAFSALMGGLLGFVFGSVEGITSKVISKAIKGMVVGSLLGVLGASLGSFLGILLFELFGGPYLEDVSSIVMARTVLWGMIGLFIGLSQGVSAGGKERAKNGLIGGLIGGATGGLMFDLFSLHIADPNLSAVLAIISFGLLIALSIGLVQEYRKEAWLRVVRGPTIGKEYIIQDRTTGIGSSPGCDVTLLRDPSIMFRHADIIFNNGYIIRSVCNKPLTINNQPVKTKKLHYGDRITIGSYEMIYLDKSID